MLSEDKFFEKAKDFALFPTTTGDYLTFEELKEQTKDAQTDKDESLFSLRIKQMINMHISKLQKQKDTLSYCLIHQLWVISSKIRNKWRKSHFTRVDADQIDKLIVKEDSTPSKLSEENQKTQNTCWGNRTKSNLYCTTRFNGQ